MTDKKDSIPKEVLITAIVALMIIEIVALFLGINGTFRMILTAAICGLAGWAIPFPHKNAK